jgi:hypothetical protein
MIFVRDFIMVTGISYAPQLRLPILLKAIAHVEPVIAHALHVSDPNQLNAIVVHHQVTIKAVRLLVLLVLLDVQFVREVAALNVQAAPQGTISNPLPIQLAAQILVQMDTIQTPQRLPALLVLLDVQSAQEAAILNAPAAPQGTISNPLPLQPLV